MLPRGELSGARLSRGVDAAAERSSKDRVDESEVSTARPLPRPALAPASFLSSHLPGSEYSIGTQCSVPQVCLLTTPAHIHAFRSKLHTLKFTSLKCRGQCF